MRSFVRLFVSGDFRRLARFFACGRGRACGCVFYISLYIRRVIGTLFPFLTGYGRDLSVFRRFSCGFNRFGRIFPVSNGCSTLPYYGCIVLTYFNNAGCWTSCLVGRLWSNSPGFGLRLYNFKIAGILRICERQSVE